MDLLDGFHSRPSISFTTCIDILKHCRTHLLCITWVACASCHVRHVWCEQDPMQALGDVAGGGPLYSEVDQDAGRTATGRLVSPVPHNHYLQNMISPRSRAEYDEFNRFHFSQLRHFGRMDKRQVTPKVGGPPKSSWGGGSQVETERRSCLSERALSILASMTSQPACLLCCTHLVTFNAYAPPPQPPPPTPPPLVQVGEDPLNRSEVSELHAELRSPVFVAEMASRARSPQLLRPRNKTDHVTDILTLERPGEVVPQVGTGR